MARFLHPVTMSLDGFIAGPDGDMSWPAPHLAPNPEAEALVPDIGALLVGAAVDVAASAAGDRYVNVLGDNTRLFSWPGGREIRRERTHVTEMPQATGLWFRAVG